MLIRGESVEVLTPVVVGADAMGEPVITWESSEVENVLFQPGGGNATTTSDLDVERPNGVRINVTFHFPKSFEGSLRGCKVKRGEYVYRVIGDPQPYMVDNTPGEWNRSVACEVVNG